MPQPIDIQLGSAAEPKLLTTGDMARESGSTLRTVRFYEEEGLIAPKGRSGGGHRHFERRELVKLQLALDLREAGLSLSDIKKLFELKTSCETPAEASREMQEVLELQIGEMQTKITNLRRLRDDLVAMVSVIDECKTCEGRRFPLHCTECDVLSRPDLSRALRVLWSR